MSSVNGGRELAASLNVSAGQVQRRVQAVVAEHGALLQTRIMAHASGRPGPRVGKTGDYRRSIRLQFDEALGRSGATVGTNAPQGNRLEHGFVGADSLGRVYNSPPYPHFVPAFLQTTPDFTGALRRLTYDFFRRTR